MPRCARTMACAACTIDISRPKDYAPVMPLGRSKRRLNQTALSSCRRIPRIEDAIHECLALRQLLERNEFIGTMRFGDIAGSTDYGGHAHLLKQPRFGAVGHLPNGRIVRELHGPADDG